MSTLAAPLVRYGFTAGAEGAGAIYPVKAGEARKPGTAERSTPVTIDEALAALAMRGARFALAELPDVAEHAELRAALSMAHFGETGRVRDFVDDGVDLVLLRRDV